MKRFESKSYAEERADQYLVEVPVARDVRILYEDVYERVPHLLREPRGQLLKKISTLTYKHSEVQSN